jgi:RIO kinase 1
MRQSGDGCTNQQLVDAFTNSNGNVKQLLLALTVMARAGFTHGDLSPYNLLVHEGRIVVIDLPQIVDLIANPQGKRFLQRDVHNVVSWFTARGLAGLDEAAITAELLAEAGAA